MAAALAGCSPAVTPAPPPPPPPAAQEITWGGPYQFATGAALLAARAAVGGAHGAVTESRNWSLPSDAAFPAVRAYYAQALKGWTAMKSLPPVLGDGPAAGWEAPGQALVISLIARPPEEGEPRKVLVVMRFER